MPPFSHKHNKRSGCFKVPAKVFVLILPRKAITCPEPRIPANSAHFKEKLGWRHQCSLSQFPQVVSLLVTVIGCCEPVWTPLLFFDFCRWLTECLPDTQIPGVPSPAPYNLAMVVGASPCYSGGRGTRIRSSTSILSYATSLSLA